jgi:molybdopterin molybdotransferase
MARSDIRKKLSTEQNMNSPALDPDASCLDEFDPNSVLPADALRRILEPLRAVTETERVALRPALDRVLAEDIRSSVNVPAATNSAMDGYAVRGTDIPSSGTATLRVLGTIFAGKPLNAELKPGEAARIMTGGVMPPGSDTVVIQERAQRDGDNVIIGPDTRTGENIRVAGEDIKVGDVVLKCGQRLSPADLGLLASLGIGEVSVLRKVKVAYFSTGDELRSIGEALGAGDVYDSNRYTLHGMLTRLGVDYVDLGVVRDDRAALEAAFNSAAQSADVVITSGGVSVGEADYIKETLRKLGDIEFWKVAIKPGRPLSYGQLGKARFFGLPGNPVSVMVTFYQFVQPALRRLMGEKDSAPLTIRARCVSKLKKRPGRVEYQRAVLERDDKGELTVRKTGMQGSGILTSMSRANCFIILPLESTGQDAGAIVEVQPFGGIV